MITDRFTAALSFAARLHREQRRKVSGEPYLAHLMSVAALTLENGGDEDQAIAALLHDAIEDQGGEPTGRTILRLFGPRVLDIVSDCTDADVEPKPPWKERKDAWLANLKVAGPRSLLVVAADKLHNLRTLLADYRHIGDEVFTRFKGAKYGTLWYYRQVVEIIAMRIAGGAPAEGQIEGMLSEMNEILDRVTR